LKTQKYRIRTAQRCGLKPISLKITRQFIETIQHIRKLRASQHVLLGKIADHRPGKMYSLSQIKKNERWLDNGFIDAVTFFAPLIIKINSKI
jgi:hypothetical protein